MQYCHIKKKNGYLMSIKGKLTKITYQKIGGKMDTKCNNIRGDREGREGITHCSHARFHSRGRPSSSMNGNYRMN
jgi:hypothetical protein